MSVAKKPKRLNAPAVLVKWTASWCAPCAALKKSGALEALAKELGVALEERDIDDEKWSNAGIQAVPTVALLTARGKVIYSDVWPGKAVWLKGLAEAQRVR